MGRPGIFRNDKDWNNFIERLATILPETKLVAMEVLFNRFDVMSTIGREDLERGGQLGQIPPYATAYRGRGHRFRPRDS